MFMNTNRKIRSQFLANFRPSNLRPISIRLFLALAGLTVVGLHSTHAATRIWSGGHASSANWNLRDNWGGIAVPANGDTVVFPSGAARLVNTNNLAGLRLHEIQFLGLGGGYSVRGASLAVSNGVTVAADAANTLSVTSVTLHGSQALGVATGGSFTVNSDLVLSNGNLTLAASGDMSLRGAISGNGGVTKNGPGLVTYFGEQDNTYRGLTTVNAGTLALNQRETISIVPLTIVSRIAVPGNLTVGDGTNAAVVRLNFDSQIANTATVTVVENAQLQFFANQDAFTDLVLRGGEVSMTTGSLVLNGDLTIQASASTASLGGLMPLNSASTFTVADGPATIDLDLSVRIGSTGGHGFSKNGLGTLRLAGTNVYLGATVINAGLVRVASDAPFGAPNNGTTIAAGAELLIETSVNTLREPLTIAGEGIGGASGVIRIGSGATIATNIVLIAPATIFTMGGGNLVIDGVISGTGPLTKIGPGTLELGGKSANTFSGNLLAQDGLLLLSKLAGSAVQSDLIVGTTNTSATARHTRSANLGGAVTVNAGSLYDLNDNNESIDALTLNSGGDVQTGNGQLTLNGDVVVNPGVAHTASTIEGRLNVGSGERHVIVGNENDDHAESADLIVSAHVSGSANISKSGGGDLSLTTSNSFTGTLTIEDGRLAVSDGHALGSAAAQTIVTGHASVGLYGAYGGSTGIAVDEPLFLNTTGEVGANALLSFGSNTWNGTIFLAQTSLVRVLTNSTLNVSGAINGLSGLTKVGAGLLIYSSASSNTYIGTTRVNDGKLLLVRGDRASINGALIVGDGLGGPDADEVEFIGLASQINHLSAVEVQSSGLLRLTTDFAGPSIGSLAGSGRVQIDGAWLVTGYNDQSTDFTGPISGVGGLWKYGSGTFALSGQNTYTGPTHVSAGVLVVNGQQPASDVQVFAGGTLKGHGMVGALSIDGTFAPGDPADRLSAVSVNFLPGSTFVTDLAGPTYEQGYGSFSAWSGVDVTAASLDLSLNFAPFAGQVFALGVNTSTNATTGIFAGRPEGAVIVRNHIPLHLSYAGGPGYSNDITLTVGELALRLGTVRVTGGNGNGVIDPDECNDLFVSIENSSAGGVIVLSAHLQPLANELIVTQGEAEYGTVPANSVRTNQTAFQVRTSAGYSCGKQAEFHLVVSTLGHGRFAIPVTLNTGKAGPLITFAAQGVPRPIPDNVSVSMPLEVTNNFRIARARVTIHTTHPSVGQLRFRLWSPGFTSVLLSDHRGGAGNNFGSGCGARLVFDDNAPLSITAGFAPFAGLYRPDENLASLVGVPSAGTWYLDVLDDVPGALGAVQCWSLELSPSECTDGGGACESCAELVQGTINDASPTMAERLWRVLPPSSCGDVQPCAGAVTFGTPPYRYATHNFTNNGPETCVTVALNVPCTNSGSGLVASAYLGDFNPAALCANLLGGSGLDAVNGSGGFSFRVPAGQRFTVVVNEHNNPDPFSGCGNYSLELYGLPCPQTAPTLHIANDASPDKVRLHWSTAYPGFQLQGKPSLGGNGVLSVFTNVATTPVVVNGHYSVTNQHRQTNNGFFRLRKP